MENHKTTCNLKLCDVAIYQGNLGDLMLPSADRFYGIVDLIFQQAVALTQTAKGLTLKASSKATQAS